MWTKVWITNNIVHEAIGESWYDVVFNDVIVGCIYTFVGALQILGVFCHIIKCLVTRNKPDKYYILEPFTVFLFGVLAILRLPFYIIWHLIKCFKSIIWGFDPNDWYLSYYRVRKVPNE